MRSCLVILATFLPSATAWNGAFPRPTRSQRSALEAQPSSNGECSRRGMLESAFAVGSLGLLTALPERADALVKGVAPPPPKSKMSGDKLKCTNVEECQEMAYKREQEMREQEELGPPPKVTAGGVRYRDMEDGSGDAIKSGDSVQLYYKVLKLGKRSYDGLSGEGTVVFSRGYGLEDDENKAGDNHFDTTVGGVSNIVALNDALVGMKLGGTRRFSVLPEKGWRKPSRFCDGGPGGAGQGGDLRTDYVVVPTATMVEQEACFDMTKLPFPATYAQQRRMAQRFDQSLILEVQVAKIN
jgi:FKBP-type peptidyl-prolyl cis-trans isomerase